MESSMMETSQSIETFQNTSAVYLRLFIENNMEIDHLIDYFDDFEVKLSKKNLISYLNSVCNE